MGAYLITDLAQTEQGFMPISKFKTLTELDYSNFERHHNYVVVQEFGHKFYDFQIFIEEAEYTIRAVIRYGNKFITREQNKLVQKYLNDF